jgi:hypothetical protein
MLLVAGTALAGCGIPADPQPHPVAPPRPFQGFTSATPPQTPDSGAATEILYLIRGGRIAPVNRPVREPPTVQMLIDDLTAGPTDAETAQGYTTVLPATAVVEGVRLDGALAVVTLGEGIDVVAQGDVPLAIGQIVCSLDAHPDVASVVFENDGVRASVPRGDAAQTDAPLTAADYVSLLELPT